jgi:predicted nucleic acid-binding protein
VPFVVDASVGLAWFFEDENDARTQSVLEQLRQDQAVVPAIWPVEMANGLLVAERRKRITEAQTARFLEILQALPISVETVVTILQLPVLVGKGRRHGLSAYDTTYLDLAERRGLPLATLDDSLRRAAERVGVALVI